MHQAHYTHTHIRNTLSASISCARCAINDACGWMSYAVAFDRMLRFQPTHTQTLKKQTNYRQQQQQQQQKRICATTAVVIDKKEASECGELGKKDMHHTVNGFIDQFLLSTFGYIPYTWCMVAVSHSCSFLSSCMCLSLSLSLGTAYARCRSAGW